MKLLMISTDRKILDENSEVRARMLMLRESFEDLRILLVSKKIFSNKVHNTQGLFIYEMSFWRAFFWRSDFFAEFTLDFVTAQDPFENGLLGWVISRKINKPLQLQVHTEFLSPFFKKESLKNRIQILIAKCLLPKADSIRVVSKRIKESLLLDSRLKILDSRIRILPAFIDREGRLKQTVSFSLREKFQEFEKIVVSVSRLEKEKNIDLVIRAFKIVVEKEPKAGLIICGDGSLRKDLEDEVKELGLEKNVKFLGWVKDTNALYRSSDLLVVASSYEGYGMNVVEASIFDLPITSTDVGVTREACAEITDLDESVLASKIIVGLNEQKKSSYTGFYSKEEYLKEYKDAIDLGKL